MTPEQLAAKLDRIVMWRDPVGPEEFATLAEACLSLMHRVAALEAASPRSRFSPPAPAEVEDYGRSIGFTVDGQQFCDHYETTGWMIGKAKIKSWQACVRKWKATANGAGRKGAVMR